MKKFAIYFCLFVSSAAFAGRPQRVTCESLKTQAEQTCDEIMCEYYTEDGEECVKDGDFYEGHGICVYDDVFPELVKEHNKKNPKAQLNCEDI